MSLYDNKVILPVAQLNSTNYMLYTDDIRDELCIAVENLASIYIVKIFHNNGTADFYLL